MPRACSNPCAAALLLALALALPLHLAAPASPAAAAAWRVITSTPSAPALPITFSEAAIAALNRTALSSCTWSPVFGTCSTTHAPLLSSLPNLTAATYAGRALAYRVAVTAYCGHFNRTSPNCSFPCSNNGEVCAPMGALLYGIYACPGSEAGDDMYCTLSSPNMTQCRANPACVYTARSGSTPASCVARFKKNFTDDQLAQYLSDWGTTRRNVWGCCQGSQAKWMNDLHCDRYSSDQKTCTSMMGCVFNNMTGDCSWSQSFWLSFNFPPSNETSTLISTSQQCPRLTSRAACNSYRLVTPNITLVRSILNLNLAAGNTPVPANTCIVWQSGEQD